MLSNDAALVQGFSDVAQVVGRLQTRVVPNGIHLDAVGVERFCDFIEKEFTHLHGQFARVVADSVLTPYRSTWYSDGGEGREARAWCSMQPETLLGSPVVHCPGGAFSRGFWTESSGYTDKVEYRPGNLIVTAGNDLRTGVEAADLLDLLSGARSAGAHVLNVRGLERGSWQRDPECAGAWC